MRFTLVDDRSVVTENGMRRCCQFLRRYAGDLAPLLCGLRIVVSDRFVVDEEGAVHIPWDVQDL